MCKDGSDGISHQPELNIVQSIASEVLCTRELFRTWTRRTQSTCIWLVLFSPTCFIYHPINGRMIPIDYVYLIYFPGSKTNQVLLV